MRQGSICSGLLSFILLFAVAAPALSKDLTRKVTVATEIYEELYGQEGDDQKRIIGSAVCIAVIPHVVKGAFWVGGHHGSGLLSCKEADTGDWSPPVFVKMTGGSFGVQFGGEVTDLVLFFMTRRGVDSLLDTEFTLGGEAGVAAGPYGRKAEASTDLKLKAEIYSYAKSRGAFIGLSIEGARLAPSQKMIKNYYGERLWPDDVLFEHQVPTLPAEAKRFMEALPGGKG
jgi:lipid-binding SYLF domain-containing protein